MGAALAAAFVFGSCGDDSPGTPGAVVRLGGADLAISDTVVFPNRAPDAGGATLTFEIVNPGSGVLALTGTPPVKLEHDDRLAFTVTQPADTRLPPNASTTFSATFDPHSEGTSTARLVIATNAPDAREIVLGVSGDSAIDGTPELQLRVAGAPLSGSLELPVTPTDEPASVTLELANAGSGRLELVGVAPLSFDGDDANAFSAAPASAAALRAGEAATVDVTFAPDGCGPHQAGLVVSSTAPGSPHRVSLSGRGIDRPQHHPGITDAANATATGAVDVASSADGSRIAVGHAAADTFTGTVTVVAWDGCEIALEDAMDGTTPGVSTALFGAQVALSDAGDTLLVTARDQQDAWIFDLAAGAPPLAAGPTAVLRTGDPGPSHGRAAALSGDGRVAVVGRPQHQLGGATRGAAFAWRRIDAAWESADVPDARLFVADAEPVLALGQTVEVSADGRVIAAGAVSERGGMGSVAAAVWEITGDGITWGQPRSLTNSYLRDQSTLLVAEAGDAGDAITHLAISDDGGTIALAAAQPGGSALVFVFERDDGGAWGVPSAAGDAIRHETAALRLTWTARARFALTPDGDAILAADQAGLRELARPASGWSAAAEPGRAWEGAWVSHLAVAADGHHVAGVDQTGALIVVWR